MWYNIDMNETIEIIKKYYPGNKFDKLRLKSLLTGINCKTCKRSYCFLRPDNTDSEIFETIRLKTILIGTLANVVDKNICVKYLDKR